MNEVIHSIWMDILQGFSTVGYSDFARPGALLIWLGMIFLPIHETDRRDMIAGLTFTFFTVGFGMAIVVILPLADGEKISIGKVIGFFLVMVLMAGLRWAYPLLKRKDPEDEIKESVPML